MNTISPRWRFILIGAFAILTAFSFLFPPFNSDSVRYSKPGNVFALQWLDFTAQSTDNGAFHNGRFYAHIILRTILQWGEPWLNIATAVLIIAVLFIFCSALKNRFYREQDSIFEASAFLLCTLLMLVFPQGPLGIWFIHAHLVANFFAMAVLLAFLLPYACLAGGAKPAPGLWLFLPLALLAGNTHEQGVAVVPLLLLLALYLRWSRRSIPLWYWLGLAVYACGLTFILAVSQSPQRLTDYGNVLAWDFMGQKINWLELGWKRYFYSFVRNYLLSPASWFLLLPIGLWAWLWKKLQNKNPSHPALGESLFYETLALMMAGVMIASPFFWGGPYGNSLFFLYLALVRIAYAYFQERGSAPRWISPLCLGAFIFVSITLMCALTIPAINYRKGRQMIIEASLRGEKSVTVPGNTTVSVSSPWGSFSIPYIFEYSPFLLDRYNLESITVTNKEESYTITR